MPTLPPTLIPNTGTLQQAVLNAQNAVAAARNAGLAEGSIRMRQLLQTLFKSQRDLQAATGSQQGMNLPRGGGGTVGTGAFIPDPRTFLTPEFSAQNPELARILNAPSPLDTVIGNINLGPAQNQIEGFLQNQIPFGNIGSRIFSSILSQISNPGTQPAGSRGVGPSPTSTAPNTFAAIGPISPGGRSGFPTAQIPITPLLPQYPAPIVGSRGPGTNIRQGGGPLRPTPVGAAQYSASERGFVPFGTPVRTRPTRPAQRAPKVRKI